MNGWIAEDAERAKQNGHEGHLVGTLDDDSKPLKWHDKGEDHEITQEIFEEWYGWAGVSEAAQEEALEMAFGANGSREDEGSDGEDSDSEGEEE